uniref:t-SNARE coiled-coil homology domain-containing protein n=1 Tax=Ananas comosus var. bracteatus TaxID=296719 RepID=A0A6V7PSF9_ANACO|nr:unnamed protein product [Ananas comosus var. bracteatus]
MNDLMTKSFLSYVDLKKAALKEDLEADGGIEMAAAEAEAAAEDEKLRPFLQEAEAVKEEIASIRGILARLQEANEESKSAHQPDALRGLRARIGADVVLVLRKARAIRDRLEAMDRSTAAAASRQLGGGTPVDRTRTAVAAGLRKRLRDLMLDFQALRQRIMAEHREAVERRYFTLTGELPADDVVERIVAGEQGQGQEQELLRKAAVAERGGSGEVLAAVQEIQGRQDAAREVERSLLELHQVFLDMAVMVEAQGEQMDDIERHVASAGNYVKDGAKELGSAKAYQRSSRKWLCIGIILLLLLVLVVIVPIAATLSSKSS